MTCDDVEMNISAFIDQELSLESSLEIESHLGRCSSCRLTRSNTQAVRTAIQNSDLYDTAPNDLSGRLMELIDRTKPAKKKLT